MQLVLRQPWRHLSGFAAVLDLELKYNRGLDVIFWEEKVRGSEPKEQRYARSGVQNHVTRSLFS